MAHMVLQMISTKTFDLKMKDILNAIQMFLQVHTYAWHSHHKHTW